MKLKNSKNKKQITNKNKKKEPMTFKQLKIKQIQKE